MSYVKASLAAGEEILAKGRYHWLFWLGAWLALLLTGWLIIGAVYFLYRVVRMSTTEFAVTNRRIVLKQGLFHRWTQEIAVESVEGVALDQGLFGQIFGYGQVIATGTGEATIEFPPMVDPVAFRRAIEEARL